MKLPKELNNLLSNKYVLYIVAFLSLTNVIAYLVAQDYNSLLFFAIIGYVASYFSKNMTIILLCALVVTNLLTTANSLQAQSMRAARREGLENMVAGDAASAAPILDSSKVAAKPAIAGGEETDDEDDEAAGGAAFLADMSPNKLQAATQDAGKLLESQKQLAKNLETMGPLLHTAREMMDTLSGSEGMLSKLGMMGGLM